MKVSPAFTKINSVHRGPALFPSVVIVNVLKPQHKRMAKEEVTERCAHCHAVCEAPQILPCGDIACRQHYPFIIREQICPICKKANQTFPICLLKDLEESLQSVNEAAGGSNNIWFGMGTKRGRERYISPPCEGWLFCDHEICYLNHQKSMGLKRGRQETAEKSNGDQLPA
ncbi:hypothetical protein ACTXT7_012759 [Hymenolepis weldensis]